MSINLDPKVDAFQPYKRYHLVMEQMMGSVFFFFPFFYSSSSLFFFLLSQNVINQIADIQNKINYPKAIPVSVIVLQQQQQPQSSSLTLPRHHCHHFYRWINDSGNSNLIRFSQLSKRAFGLRLNCTQISQAICQIRAGTLSI